ncbi:MAG: TatD family hydrolase [Planctomycetaceae bacterium]
MHLVDTHAHLDEDAFSFDRTDVVTNAAAAGVTRIVTIGTTLASSRAALAIAAEFPGVYAAVGIHPNYAAVAQPDDWVQIEQLVTQPRAVGIGETGLDRYWDHTPIEVQQDYFDLHLDLSRRSGKPFIVHCREADADVVVQLRRAAGQGGLHGVMHSFAGSSETADVCLELGMYLSFAGMITYKKSAELRQIAARVPADRILVETDSPYLAPVPNRGKRNEPAWVRHTAELVAQLRGVSLEEFAAQTTANAKRLFALE